MNVATAEPIQISGTYDLVINPVIGCHYFPPGLRLPSQLKSITAAWLVPSYLARRGTQV